VGEEVPCRQCGEAPGNPRRGLLCQLCYGDMLEAAAAQGFPIDQPLTRRLVAKLDMGGPVPAHNLALGPCWMWVGGTNNKGYGVIRIDPDQVGYVHDLVFDWVHGPPPPGHQRDHICHKADDCTAGDACPHRRCCHPRHMEAVTARVNGVERGGGPSAKNAAATHCGRCGLPLAGVNLYIGPDGRRRCRACRRSDRAWERVVATATPASRRRSPRRRAARGQLPLPLTFE
jgi:hypothetical protein